MKEKTKDNLVRNAIRLQIDTNAIVTEGDDTLMFPKGLVITDTTTMWDGMRYDINTLDIDQYNLRVFADHNYDIKNIVGTLTNIYKLGDKVITDGIRFSGNPMGRLAYDLVKSGHLDTVSIGTLGPWADENNIYRDHVMIDTSWVGIPNNKNATVNEAIPLMELAVQCGLKADNYRKENSMEDEKDKVVTPAEPDKVEETPKEEAPAENTVASLVKDLKNELEDLKKFKVEHSKEVAKEPEFKAGEPQGVPAVATVTNKVEGMSGKERTKRQAQLAFNRMFGDEYVALNEANMKDIVSKKSELESITKNVMTMDEESFGGFIPCYELLSEIVGCRTNYDALLNVFGFEQSDNLQYAWNLRVGDIDMQSVEMCDDGENGNLKPVSEYGLQLQTRSMEELAAVTPVCNAATLFAVGDLLRDVANGYQNSRQRNFARLVVAELQKAVDQAVTGKVTGGPDIVANTGASVVATSADEWDAILTAITEVIDCTPDGILVMSTGSYSVLQGALIRAGLNNGGMTDLITSDGAKFNSYLGRRVVTVPNDLMPKLGTSDTVTITTGGASVSVDHAIFYIDPSNWRGVTFGSGLQYDLSREAAYEVIENSVLVTKSAFQRNELVLRGSMFRGGGVKDFRQVAGILAETSES